MDRATYETVAAEIEDHARRFARAWPRIPADDFRQEGWVVALASLHRFDPAKGDLGPWLGRALTRKLSNFAWRSALPVRTPRNHEHRFADRARATSTDALTGAVDPYPAPEDAYAEVEAACIVREAVGVATADEPRLVEVFLGDESQSSLAKKHGGSVGSWEWKLRKARAVLRDELRGVEA